MSITLVDVHGDSFDQIAKKQVFCGLFTIVNYQINGAFSYLTE